MRKKFSTSKKIICAALSTTTIFFLSGLATNAHADWNPFSLAYIQSSVIGYIALVISYLISTLFAVVIGLETYIISVILNISLDIINSPVVQVGFPITLSIANLGFVVALIIMAIGTIIRSNSYNQKQMLTKLVGAAILVNFSLVIVGSLLRTSDIFTKFFIHEVNPFTASKDEFFDFTSAVAGSFNPQHPFVTAPNENEANAWYKQLGGAQIADSIGKSMSAWMGIVLQLITLVGIVITLGYLALMLVYRYVSILFLIVIMPLAWLMSIFKEYEVHWQSWWKEFIKQLVFAPVVIFFLYLAIQTAKGLGTVTQQYRQIPDAFGAGFEASLGRAMADILSMLTISGIMAGGMLAASRLGHETGKTAVSAIKGASGKITGTLLTRPAGRVGRGAAIAAANSKAGKGASQLLQNIVSGVDTKNLKGANKLGAQAFNAIAAIPGVRQVARVAGSSLDNQTKALSEAQKKSFAEEIKGDSRNINKARLNSEKLTGTEFVEAVKAAIAGGYITEIKNLEQQLANNKDAFASIDEKSLHQKLGGFHYEERDKLDDKGNPIKDTKRRKTNPDGTNVAAGSGGEVEYENQKERVVVGDRTLLADTKIAEIKKQIKEKNTSEAQLAALLNDEEELKKTDKDKIIAIIENLIKEEKLQLVKDPARAIKYLTNERNDKGEITETEDKSYTKLDAAGNFVPATYIESIGKDKLIKSVKNSTGLSLVETYGYTDSKEDQEKYKEKIKEFYNQDPKAVANILANSIKTLNTTGITPQQLEESQMKVAAIYKNLGQLQADKLNGIMKELTKHDSFNQAKFEESIEAAKKGFSSTKVKAIKIELSNSVLKQSQPGGKPHIAENMFDKNYIELFKPENAPAPTNNKP